MDVAIKVYILLYITLDNIKLLQSARESCDEQCLVEPYIGCSVTQDAACESASYNPTNGLWPSAPFDLDAKVTTDGEDSLVSVSWIRRTDASSSYVTGFLLQITELPASERECVHINLTKRTEKDINLTGSTSERLNKDVVFELSCLSGVTLRGTYYLHIQSIPLPPPSHSAQNSDDLYVAFVPVDAGTATGWLSVIKFEVKSYKSSRGSRIRVDFKLGPPVFVFTEYDVSLYGTTDNLVQEQHVRMAWDTEETYERVQFENVCSGEYQIMVQPHKVSLYNNSCTCGETSGRCNSCSTAATARFYVNPEMPCEQPDILSTTTPHTTPSTDRPLPEMPGDLEDRTTIHAASGTADMTLVVSVVTSALVLLGLSIIVISVIICKKKQELPPERDHCQSEKSQSEGKVAVWQDFHWFKSPQPSELFIESTSADIKAMNDDQSRMFTDHSKHQRLGGAMSEEQESCVRGSL